MIAALCAEIALAPRYAANEVIETIYLGGGTPSILPTQDLAEILALIRQQFVVADSAEITMEANPDDIDAGTLQSWLQLGINRLSVGIQSFNENELAWMNRAHTAAEAITCIHLIGEAGYHNYSIDLIYGSPLLTDEDWHQHVHQVIAAGVPHISCYALTVEPATVLDHQIKQQRKQPVDPEKQARQFLLLIDWLTAAGYEHYEISNFALPGCRSRHNSSYWQGTPYYGFGPAAHAFNGQQRSWNIANNMQYIQALKAGHIPSETELLTITQQRNEYIMTALRTMEGIHLKHPLLQDETVQQQLLQQASAWISGDKLFIKDEALVLTTQGKLFADGIAADLFF